MRTTAILMGVCALWATACDKSEGRSGAQPSATASATHAAPLASTAPSASATKRELYPLREGPVLAILRGQGLGPIRFGATRQTVERLMAKPCRDATERVCRYPARAVEFVFGEDGGAVEMIVFGLHEPIGDTTAGMFNGRAPNGLSVGMIKPGVLELAGPPQTTEKLEGKDGVVERLVYDDIHVDLRQKDNGELVMARLKLLAPTKGKQAPKGASK